MSCPVISYHVMSHLITSGRVSSHRTMSCLYLAMSYHVLSHRVGSCRVLSSLVALESCHVKPCQIVSHRIRSHQTLSRLNLTMSCRVLAYPIVSHRVGSSRISSYRAKHYNFFNKSLSFSTRAMTLLLLVSSQPFSINSMTSVSNLI